MRTTRSCLTLAALPPHSAESRSHRDCLSDEWEILFEATPRDGGGAAIENEDGFGKPEAYRTVLRQSRHSISPPPSETARAFRLACHMSRPDKLF
jgi:hypothetical protein